MRSSIFLLVAFLTFAHIIKSSALSIADISGLALSDIALPFLSTTLNVRRDINFTASTSPQNFTCDNCTAFKSLLIQCLNTIPQNATTTVNDVQLPLQQCLCNQTNFYEAFGDCETGCASKPTKSQDAFQAQCKLFLSNSPPALPTSPSGTILVSAYVSKLSALPTTINPTLLLNGQNLTATANSSVATANGSVATGTSGGSRASVMVEAFIAWMIVVVIAGTVSV